MPRSILTSFYRKQELQQIKLWHNVTNAGKRLKIPMTSSPFKCKPIPREEKPQSHR